MTRKLLALSALMAATAPVFGHHSEAAEFDQDKPVKVTGTIVKVEWLNPHVWFYVDVKDEQGQRDDLGIFCGASGRADASGHHQGRPEDRRCRQRRGLTRTRRLQQRFGPQRDIPRRQKRVYGNRRGWTMKTSWLRSSVVAAALVIAIERQHPMRQDIPRMPDGKPDFSGIYTPAVDGERDRARAAT